MKIQKVLSFELTCSTALRIVLVSFVKKKEQNIPDLGVILRRSGKVEKDKKERVI